MEGSSGFVLSIEHIGGKRYARACPDGVVVIGRSAKAELQIVDATISSMHVRFTVQGGRAWVEDLGSKNGTWIADRRLPAGEIAEIAAGAPVKLGDLFTVTYAEGPLPPVDFPNPFAFSFETAEGDQTGDNAPAAVAALRVQSGEIARPDISEPPHVRLPWMTQAPAPRASTPPSPYVAAPPPAASPPAASPPAAFREPPPAASSDEAPAASSRGRIVFGHGPDVVEFSSSAQHPTRSPVKPGSATIVQVLPQMSPAPVPASAPPARPGPAAPVVVAAPVVAAPVAPPRPAPSMAPQPPPSMRSPYEIGVPPRRASSPAMPSLRAPYELGSPPAPFSPPPSPFGAPSPPPSWAASARPASPLPPPLSAIPDQARAPLPQALSSPRLDEPPPLAIPRQLRSDNENLPVPTSTRDDDDEDEDDRDDDARPPARGKRGDHRGRREPARRAGARGVPGRRRRRSNAWTFPLMVVGGIAALGFLVWLILHLVVSHDERSRPAAPVGRHRAAGEPR